MRVVLLTRSKRLLLVSGNRGLHNESFVGGKSIHDDRCKAVWGASDMEIMAGEAVGRVFAALGAAVQTVVTDGDDTIMDGWISARRTKTRCEGRQIVQIVGILRVKL